MSDLAPGSRLGTFEVVSLIGAGGMGQVYRARDTDLHRDVAVKILLPEVAHDPDRLARFSREAQVLASLNHPHIAHVYGIEQAGDVRGLVMELVEGPTLEDRLRSPNSGLRSSSGLPASGPGLEVPEALAIARQIADALDAAHEQGIIHRTKRSEATRAQAQAGRTTSRRTADGSSWSRRPPMLNRSRRPASS